MKELRSIVDTYKSIDFSRHKAAIATVVRVEGSSYRRSGARMIIIDDGRWTGSISGGCLEGDALRKARQAILLGSPSLVTYDTMKDKDAMNLGVGLGCNGVIDVLIEPIDPEKPRQIDFLQKVQQNNKPAVMATIYASSLHDQQIIGKQWLMEDPGRVTGFFDDHVTLPVEAFEKELIVDMGNAFKDAVSGNKVYTIDNNTIDVFVEFLRPSIHLIIFGGGFDAIPLMNFSKQLGWKVTITDDCVAHIAPARFPMADKLLHASRFEVVEKVSVNEYTAAILLSHNFKYDIAIFKDLLKTDIQYIGILGPRKKFDKMVEQLNGEGISIQEEMMDRIHAPVGLDLGAELPEEIAISIIAEVQAKFNNCSGEMLRSKDGPIHGRINKEQYSASLSGI